MAKIDLSMMWKNSMNDVYASTIPAFLKEKGLYDGTSFRTTRMPAQLRSFRQRSPRCIRRANSLQLLPQL